LKDAEHDMTNSEFLDDVERRCRQGHTPLNATEITRLFELAGKRPSHQKAAILRNSGLQRVAQARKRLARVAKERMKA
jgi:hypothetical protein